MRYDGVVRRWLWVVLLATSSVARAGADPLAEIRSRRAADIEALWRNAGLTRAPSELYLRAFKREAEVEVWGGPGGAPLVLLKRYPICYASGVLGPKRREGDLQVPEGLYEVGRMNPQSSYHLALEVTYPNASDRQRSDKAHPGGEIYLHGNCVSIGCIAIQDEPIEEVYLLAAGAKRPIRFDVFPMHLDADALGAVQDAALLRFWQELAPAYRAFEAKHRPAAFRVEPGGAYKVRE